jgi:hypothetical protein
MNFDTKSYLKSIRNHTTKLVIRQLPLSAKENIFLRTKHPHTFQEKQVTREWEQGIFFVDLKMIV